MKKIDYSLGDGIIAFTTLRNTKDFSGKYHGFNTCHYVDDDVEHVSDCRKELASVLEVSEDDILIPRQTHSARCEIVDRFMTPGCPELEGLDSMVTDMPGKALVIHTADCVPVLLSDPVVGVVAAVHCGWRGIVAGIIENTVANMINVGAKPKRIHAQLGPHISARNYEIGADLLPHFDEEEIIVSEGRYFLRLDEAVRRRLVKVGVESANICSCDMCTYSSPENLWSARRDGIDTGRMATVIMLKN